MIKVSKTGIRRCKWTDDTRQLVQSYTGKLDTPPSYNAACANALRAMADKIETVRTAYVDPEFGIWLHQPGRIQAQVTLSQQE
jgi:hypothetical protein